jgi:hypothetical protein
MEKKEEATRRAPVRRSTGTRTRRVAADARALVAPTHDEIAEAAYHRYLSRGGEHGRDFDDWLEAERDLHGQRGPR